MHIVMTPCRAWNISKWLLVMPTAVVKTRNLHCRSILNFPLILHAFSVSLILCVSLYEILQFFLFITDTVHICIEQYLSQIRVFQYRSQILLVCIEHHYIVVLVTISSLWKALLWLYGEQVLLHYTLSGWNRPKTWN